MLFPQPHSSINWLIKAVPTQPVHFQWECCADCEESNVWRTNSTVWTALDNVFKFHLCLSGVPALLETLFWQSLATGCLIIPKMAFLLLFQVPSSKSVRQSHQQVNHHFQFTPYLSYQLACITITPYCRRLYYQVLLSLVNVLPVIPSSANSVSGPLYPIALNVIQPLV